VNVVFSVAPLETEFIQWLTKKKRDFEGELLAFSIQLRVFVFCIIITEKYANEFFIFGIQRTFLNDMTKTIILNNVTWTHSVRLAALIFPWSVRIISERGLEL
jgi:hypothetical protein